MSFLRKLQATLDEEFNVSVTENGAEGYRTTGSELLDLNFAISSLRKRSDEDIKQMFTKAYFEDRLLAIKWMFYAGDVRKGIGERRLFRVCLKYLADNHPDQAKKLLPLVAEYTRWDNLFCLLDGALKNDVLELVAAQLSTDVENMEKGESISLLAKWLPSVNASSYKTKKNAATIVEYLKTTKASYRKTLSALRAYSNVVEVNMSAKEWGLIDYEKVPSRANLIYKDAFLRNDAVRRAAFLSALERGEATINAGVLFPHDIVRGYTKTSVWYSMNLLPYDVAIEEMWKALPDYVEGENSTICVADGSGSMTCHIGKTDISAIEVANALAIYFAERCAGDFKDKYITFSENPQLVDLSKGNSLREKLEIAFSYNEVANTNIQAVFELILTTAINGKMKQADLPKNILILSDMEFDNAITYEDDYERLFTVIGKRYAENGYRLPRLVFWNLNSRSNTIPVKENDLGAALVSGFSPTILKMVLSSELDPFKALLEVLNDERYAPVEEALKN